jgi:hypothetical protein
LGKGLKCEGRWDLFAGSVVDQTPDEEGISEASLVKVGVGVLEVAKSRVDPTESGENLSDDGFGYFTRDTEFDKFIDVDERGGLFVGEFGDGEGHSEVS